MSSIFNENKKLKLLDHSKGQTSSSWLICNFMSTNNNSKLSTNEAAQSQAHACSGSTWADKASDRKLVAKELDSKFRKIATLRAEHNIAKVTFSSKPDGSKSTLAVVDNVIETLENAVRVRDNLDSIPLAN